MAVAAMLVRVWLWHNAKSVTLNRLRKTSRIQPKNLYTLKKKLKCMSYTVFSRTFYLFVRVVVRTSARRG